MRNIRLAQLCLGFCLCLTACDRSSVNQSNQNPGSNSNQTAVNVTGTPQPRLTCTSVSADFIPRQTTMDRSQVEINGFQMKENATKTDVESEGFTDDGTSTGVRPASAVSPNSTKMFCAANLSHHSKANDRVRVRIRCVDGAFSTWVDVKK